MPTIIEILAGLRQRGAVPQQTAAESHAMFRERSPEEREAEDRKPQLNRLIQGAADPLQDRIDRLRAGQPPQREYTRVRVEDLVIIARALGTYRLVETDEDDLAILDIDEHQRAVLTEVRVEWFRVG